MTALWPRLSDIRIDFSLIARSGAAGILSDEAFRALTALVAHSAAGMVWTYSEPGDGSLPDDDVNLARITGLGKRRWGRLRKEVELFFDVRGGKWHLNEPWVSIDTSGLRAAIPQRVLKIVEAREGRVCTYCGTTNGPFDFDHILPVSRGGLNDASNLTLACETCNRSKGGRTLREWMR
jgi:5-methylcytosine-specific restriction endonuclease McrA